jgi:hypothetical protein
MGGHERSQKQWKLMRMILKISLSKRKRITATSQKQLKNQIFRRNYGILQIGNNFKTPEQPNLKRKVYITFLSLKKTVLSDVKHYEMVSVLVSEALQCDELMP